ncbi:PLP-dependent aminotransferase family protein [Arsenicitalea aurantiaca]|uniref:PLP-dependent aminotransferase family protein n=1 Tax=Arsenicitalea aurantiaca TaxID=1783274 RepID=A0A433X5Q0_9HYPH|nr:PLP-dependent aminotransferase family protein [Arsenicitalea aurantiaca]RUT29410.1 PLP-dependent aminotransferase family protein [Arsenicitalea aurantiaca]
MAEWLPRLDQIDTPRYGAIVDALERDIASGTLVSGTRLLPQREMAGLLGVSVGMVSRAYAEAERRGLIRGEVGRGTFVDNRPSPAAEPRRDAGPGLVDLALNVPPDTGATALVETLLAEIAGDSSVHGLCAYLPHQGMAEHRAAVADWLEETGYPVSAERVYITHGAQHGLFLALSMVAASGDTILTEELTYAGITSLSALSGYRIHGVRMDGHGLVPEALDTALGETGARAVYAMPTYQTPTGRSMPPERRREIAEVVRRRDAWFIEDDAYGFLPHEPLLPVSAMIPERAFYAVSFAKCLSPGLRIGALVPPTAFRGQAINALRATGWMATPAMAEVVRRAIRGGQLADQARRKREEAMKRQRAAQAALGTWLSPVSVPGGFHVWLELPRGRTLDTLIAQANSSGLRLAASSAVGGGNGNQLNGVRLCLGGAESLEALEGALKRIAEIVGSVEEISLV